MVEVIQFDEKHFGGDGYFVKVTNEEAMRIIKTLSSQILNNNINIDREEFSKRTEDDVSYFTIGVKGDGDQR